MELTIEHHYGTTTHSPPLSLSFSLSLYISEYQWRVVVYHYHFTHSPLSLSLNLSRKAAATKPTMEYTLRSVWVCSLLLMIAHAHSQARVDVTLLQSAVSRGAVCLDGSAPGYSYSEGFGNGLNNWIVYLQGGGWCNTIENCRIRSNDPKGSSQLFPQQTNFTGILDLDPTFNPDFFDWHKIYIYYCDGASFMADVENPASNLMFRGARIFQVMMEEFLFKGMTNAHNAILTGGSAGSLAAAFHCDEFQTLFVRGTRVKCVLDSSFFIRGEGFPGVEGREEYFREIVATHELANYLPTSCTNKLDPSLCFFPENFVGDIKAPVFILESAFDTFRIKFGLAPYFGGRIAWADCLLDITYCNSTELKIMNDFRAIFIEALLKLNHSPNRGFFVHSFYRHAHLAFRNGWTCSSVYSNNILGNKTIGEAVGDWFFDRSPFEMIDIQNDIPRSSSNIDTQILDQACLLFLSSNSAASIYVVNILCILAQILCYLYVFI